MDTKKIVGLGAGIIGVSLIGYALLKTGEAAPDIYICPYCGAEFETYEELVLHIEQEHPGVSPEPELTLSNLTITPNPCKVGEPVVATVTATNTGGLPTEATYIRLTGPLSTSELVPELQPGESYTVTFESFTCKTGGKVYTICVDGLCAELVCEPTTEFTLSNLRVSPLAATPGEGVTFTVMVTNVGDVTERYMASLFVNDTLVDTETTYDLDPGESEDATLYWIPLVEGTFTIRVDGLTIEYPVLPGAAIEILGAELVNVGMDDDLQFTGQLEVTIKNNTGQTLLVRPDGKFPKGQILGLAQFHLRELELQPGTYIYTLPSTYEATIKQPLYEGDLAFWMRDLATGEPIFSSGDPWTTPYAVEYENYAHCDVNLITVVAPASSPTYGSIPVTVEYEVIDFWPKASIDLKIYWCSTLWADRSSDFPNSENYSISGSLGAHSVTKNAKSDTTFVGAALEKLRQSGFYVGAKIRFYAKAPSGRRYLMGTQSIKDIHVDFTG